MESTNTVGILNPPGENKKLYTVGKIVYDLTRQGLYAISGPTY